MLFGKFQFSKRIIPLVFLSKEQQEYPFLNGSGFFIRFNDVPNFVFILTASHCIPNACGGKYEFIYPIDELDKTKGNIKYSYCLDSNKLLDRVYDDFSIIVVPKNINFYFDALKNRCFIIPSNKDFMYSYVECLYSNHKECEVFGYPQNYKEIDYSSFCATVKPKSFCGITDKDDKNQYILRNCNWDDKDEFQGFSGSPVVDLYTGLPVGIVKTGSNSIIHFTPLWIVVHTILTFISDSFS